MDAWAVHVPENKETSVHSSARDSYMHNTCMHESNDVCFAPSDPGLLPQIADSSDIVGHHGPRPSPSSLNLSLLHASVHVIHAAKPLYVFAAAPAAHVFVVLALRSLCIRRDRGGVEPRLPGTQGFRTQVRRNAMPVPLSAQDPGPETPEIPCSAEPNHPGPRPAQDPGPEQEPRSGPRS